MSSTKRGGKFLIWLNIAAFIVTLIINGLAGGTTLIGGQNTAQVSNLYSSFITPPGYVFSIWAVIYFLLGVFIVFQALPSQRNKKFQKRVGYLFTLSSLFNISWLFLWQYKFTLFSIIPMVLLLATLLAIYLRLDIGKSKAPSKEKWAVQLPFSIYFAWITIATIADIGAAVISLNLNGFSTSATALAASGIVAALIITLLVTLKRRGISYSIVVIWALLGIAVNKGQNSNVALIAEISIAVLSIVLVSILIMNLLRIGKGKRRR